MFAASFQSAGDEELWKAFREGDVNAFTAVQHMFSNKFLGGECGTHARATKWLQPSDISLDPASVETGHVLGVSHSPWLLPVGGAGADLNAMSDNSWLRKLRADFMADPNLFRLIDDKASAPPSCSLNPKKAGCRPRVLVEAATFSRL